MGQRSGDGPIILHSDRGTQYTSVEYQRFLADHGIVCSMRDVASCYDNAVAEGFFGLLKRERVNRCRYRTRAEARVDVFDYIERFYNRRRRHSHTCHQRSLTESWKEYLNSPVRQTRGEPGDQGNCCGTLWREETGPTVRPTVLFWGRRL